MSLVFSIFDYIELPFALLVCLVTIIVAVRALTKKRFFELRGILPLLTGALLLVLRWVVKLKAPSSLLEPLLSISGGIMFIYGAIMMRKFKLGQKADAHNLGEIVPVENSWPPPPTKPNDL